MKRLARYQRTVLEDHWTIDIYPKEDKVVASSILDTQSNEYQSFIEGITMSFLDYGYELFNDPEYTHESNVDNSQSWYYTFIRVEGDVELRVFVHVRISDHVNKDKPWGTAKQRRAKYVNSLGNKLADSMKSEHKPIKIPVDIIFNDDNYRSYSSALIAVQQTLEELEEDLAEEN